MPELIFSIQKLLFTWQNVEFAVNKIQVARLISFSWKRSNYKITHRNFGRGKRLPNQPRNQKSFHDHYLSGGHNGIDNWEITIKDHAETVNVLGEKELDWYRKLKTYASFDINDCILDREFLLCSDITY